VQQAYPGALAGAFLGMPVVAALSWVWLWRFAAWATVRRQCNSRLNQLRPSDARSLSFTQRYPRIVYIGDPQRKLSGKSVALRGGGRCAVSAARKFGGDSAPPSRALAVSGQLRWIRTPLPSRPKNGTPRAAASAGIPSRNQAASGPEILFKRSSQVLTGAVEACLHSFRRGSCNQAISACDFSAYSAKSTASRRSEGRAAMAALTAVTFSLSRLESDGLGSVAKSVCDLPADSSSSDAVG